MAILLISPYDTLIRMKCSPIRIDSYRANFDVILNRSILLSQKLLKSFHLKFEIQSCK